MVALLNRLTKRAVVVPPKETRPAHVKGQLNYPKTWTLLLLA